MEPITAYSYRPDPSTFESAKRMYDTLMESCGYWRDYNIMRAKACMYDLQQFLTSESPHAIEATMMYDELDSEIRKYEE